MRDSHQDLKHLVLEHPVRRSAWSTTGEKLQRCAATGESCVYTLLCREWVGESKGNCPWVERGHNFGQVFSGGMGRLCLGFHGIVDGGPKQSRGDTVSSAGSKITKTKTNNSMFCKILVENKIPQQLGQIRYQCGVLWVSDF